ncbi:MAG: hypothetical protein AAGJ70_07505 [Pseudomonadota bacterium]
MIRLFAILAGGCLGFACALLLAYSVTTVPEPRASGPTFADARSPSVIIEAPVPAPQAGSPAPVKPVERVGPSVASKRADLAARQSKASAAEAVSLRLQMQRQSAVYRLQYAMAQIGCFEGAIDGRWSLSFHSQLDALLTKAELNGSDEKPIDDVAHTIRGLGSEACVTRQAPKEPEIAQGEVRSAERAVARMPLPEHTTRTDSKTEPAVVASVAPPLASRQLVKRHPGRLDVTRVEWPDADDVIAQEEVAIVTEVQPTAAERVEDTVLAPVRRTTIAIAAAQSAEEAPAQKLSTPTPTPAPVAEVTPPVVAQIASEHDTEASDRWTPSARPIAALGAPEPPVEAATVVATPDVDGGATLIPLPVRPGLQAQTIKARLSAVAAAEAAKTRDTTSRGTTAPRPNRPARQRTTRPTRTVAQKAKPAPSWKKNRTQIFKTRR